MHQIILTDDETILPSSLLSNESWVQYAVNLLGLYKISTLLTEVTPFDKEKSDTLLRKLEGRYSSHMRTRFNDTSKHNYWVLTLAYKNLHVVSLCMILLQHLAMDINCLVKLTSLLPPHTNTFIPCAGNGSVNRHGAYLYFDNNRGVFVRSGKVVQQGFVE